MTVDELSDLVTLVRKEMKGRIDPRFRLTSVVRNYENDNLMLAVDYVMGGGKCATSTIVIDKEQCDALTLPQVVEYVQNEILSANLDVMAFVDEGITP